MTRPNRMLAGAALCLAACSGSAGNTTTDAHNEASGNATLAIAQAKPAAKPKAQAARPVPRVKGLSWLLKTNTNEPAMAVYGPPEAGSYVALSCAPKGLDVSLLDVEPHPARARAVLTSGANRVEAPTIMDADVISSVTFVVPDGHPAVASMPTMGFTVAFRNGESNPFPGDPIVGKIIDICRAQIAMKGKPSAVDGWAGDYHGQGDGGFNDFTFAPTNTPGRYKIEGSVGGGLGVTGEPSGCGGGVEGIGIARGDTVTMTIPSASGTGPQCVMSFTRQGARVIVNEEGCYEFHGASCGFDGSMTRR